MKLEIKLEIKLENECKKMTGIFFTRQTDNQALF